MNSQLDDHIGFVSPDGKGYSEATLDRYGDGFNADCCGDGKGSGFYHFNLGGYGIGYHEQNECEFRHE